MNRFIMTLVGIVLLLVMCANAIAELVQNGDFESPVVSGSYGMFSAITGWQAAFGLIEIQASNAWFGGRQVSGQAMSGNQFVELDADENGGMFQDISTIIGNNYLLSFYYSPRNGIDGNSFPASTNQIDVFWDGSLVKSISDDGPSTVTNNWRLVEVSVQAQSQTGFSRLQFNAAGTSDGVGGLIDLVSVTEVPEPAMFFTLGMGALSLGFVWRRKRAN